MDEKFTRFILENEGADTTRLLLSRDKYPELDMGLAASTLEGRSKMRKKVPSWYAVPSIVYPDRLCCEQCSSEKASLYKAEIVRKISGGGRIADLTGGLGVDSWAFSLVSDKVLYNERNTVLSEAARHNFKELGRDNIMVKAENLAAGSCRELLGTFNPSLIYLDPARRSNAGRKVFLLEDCSPDIVTLKDELLEYAPLLVKLSPMADISMVMNRLGNVKNLWVTGYEGECKELIVYLEKGWDGFCTLTVREEDNELSFNPEEGPMTLYAKSPEELGTYLFEPGKALSKSGMADAFCCSRGLCKIDRNTNLYTGESDPGTFGRTYRIIEAAELDKRSISSFSSRYPDAAVTARNIPMDSASLRHRLGSKEKGGTHIFGCRLCGRNYLIACEKA